MPLSSTGSCMQPGLIRRAVSSWNPSAWTMMRCIRKCMMLTSCEAADRNEALIADVGKRFYEEAAKQDIFAEDGCHPNEPLDPGLLRR